SIVPVVKGDPIALCPPMRDATIVTGQNPIVPVAQIALRHSQIVRLVTALVISQDARFAFWSQVVTSLDPGSAIKQMPKFLPPF
ncbi:hypothetical protein D7Y13_42175, partial [Corallococcus praedator]